MSSKKTSSNFNILLLSQRSNDPVIPSNFLYNLLGTLKWEGDTETSGDVTASSFVGDGSSLTGIGSSPISYVTKTADYTFLSTDYMVGADGSRDRKSTRLNSSHIPLSRMPSSA